MAKFRKLKFNGNKYPYVQIVCYDYDTNKDKIITVSTDILKADIEDAIKEGKPETRQSINEINSKVKHFVPHTMLINDTLENIRNYVQSQD